MVMETSCGYMREGRHTYFVTKLGQKLRRYEEVAMLVDLKHGLVLAHGDPNELREKYARIEKGCLDFGVVEHFKRHIKLIVKADWDMADLNGVLADLRNIPLWIRQQYVEKRSMRRVPVLEMTTEIRWMIEQDRAESLA